MTKSSFYTILRQGGVVTALLLLLAFPVAAQRTSAQVTVQPAEILIGEQALLDLKVITPKETTIHFPAYEKEIVPGVEVIAMLPPDTTIEHNVMTLHFKYVITSFDSTLYHVPFIPVYDGKDTIFSNSFGLKVVSPELSDSTKIYLERINRGETDSIDFKQLQLNDIKPIRKPPFVWTDYLWILWLMLGALLIVTLIAAVIYLVLRKKKKGYFFAPPQPLPAHVRALNELDQLKASKIWQQGRIKEFYTKLTDILRLYIYEREEINAKEMTSGEILNEIRKVAEVDSVYVNLKQILSTADLVKFAKYEPYPDENDLSLVNAYFFVNQTREPDPIVKEDEKVDAVQETASAKASETVLETASGKVSETASETVPETALKTVSENASETISETVSEAVKMTGGEAKKND